MQCHNRRYTVLNWVKVSGTQRPCVCVCVCMLLCVCKGHSRTEDMRKILFFFIYGKYHCLLATGTK